MDFSKQILESGFSVLLNWSKITLLGDDANDYLHRQTTNNVQSLKNNQFQLNSFLGADGKINSFFILHKDGERIHLYMPTSLGESTYKHIEKFHIIEEFTTSSPVKEKVFLNFTSNFNQNSVIGEFYGVVCSLSNKALTQTSLDHEQCGLFFNILGYQSEIIDKLLSSTLLAQYALDSTKGCYPGQEPISKVLNNRGAAYYPVLLKAPTDFVSSDQQINYQNKTIAKDTRSFKYLNSNYLSANMVRDFRINEKEITINDHGQTAIVYLFPFLNYSKNSFAEVLFQQATQKVLENANESARNLLNSILCIRPYFEDAIEILGVLEAKENNYQKAIDWMKRLSSVNPNSIMAQTNMSLYYMKIGEIELAEKHKEEATYLSFKSMAPKIDQQLEEQNRKLEMFNKVLLIDAQDTMANIGIGQIYYEQKKIDEAIIHLNRVLEVDPKYSQAYLYLGKSLIALKEKSTAKDILKRGIEIAAQKGELMPANEMELLLRSLA